MKIPTSLIMTLLDGAALVTACYNEAEERQFLAVCKQMDVNVIGVFTPDEAMRSELNLPVLREAWANNQPVPMERAWNASTSVKKECGQWEW